MITKPSEDHLGNGYPSEKAMCRAYGINQALYKQRLARGMGQEEALTAPPDPGTKAKASTDHTGELPLLYLLIT